MLDNSIIRKGFLCLIVLIFLIISYSCGETLDRNNASTLIKKHEYFITPVMDKALIGNLNWAFIRGVIKYDCLQKVGYLKIVPRPNNYGEITSYDVIVTEKGRSIGRVINNAFEFKVYDFLFIEIDRIKKTSDSDAIAYFRFKKGNFSEVYQCMSKPDINIYTGTALLGKYDAGWRVEGISLK